MEIYGNKLVNTIETNLVYFFIKLCRDVNHGKPYYIGGHSSKVKVTMGIIDKCGVGGDTTLCVVYLTFLLRYSCPRYSCAMCYRGQIVALLGFHLSVHQSHTL